MLTRYSTLDTPLGELLLLGNGRALTGVYMDAQKYAPAADSGRVRDDNAFGAAREQLQAYFSGTLQRFDLPLELAGTEFQRRVWAALLEIPFGATESYGALARRIGMPNASRAVGLANGHNPVSIIVPCHRVIGGTGALTGYGGGLDRKRWLLAHESRAEFALT